MSEQRDRRNEVHTSATLAKYLERLRETPTQRDEEKEAQHLFHGKAKYSKAQVRELVTLLPERNIKALKLLIRQELFLHGVKRFPIEEIVKWIDVISLQDFNPWSVYEIVQLLDKLEIEVPPRDLARWGMKGIDWSRGEKKPGSLLLIRPEVRMLKELNEKEIIFSAERAAERGDHAATRLLGLLIHRWRSPKKHTMKEEHIQRIACIIYHAFKSREPRYFSAEFMLGMISGGLHRGTFEAVKSHYIQMVKEYVHYEKREFAKSIKEHVENCVKIVPVVE